MTPASVAASGSGVGAQVEPKKEKECGWVISRKTPSFPNVEWI
jgi:hypothetical protein